MRKEASVGRWNKNRTYGTKTGHFFLIKLFWFYYVRGCFFAYQKVKDFSSILTWVSSILTWVSDRHREVLITSLPPSMKFENGASFLD